MIDGAAQLVLRGVIIGHHVVVDPARQSPGVNLKSELKKLGVHQRDLEDGQEHHLSCQQVRRFSARPPQCCRTLFSAWIVGTPKAFFLMDELKRLDIYESSGSASLQGELHGPLSPVACWERFCTIDKDFMRTAGAYRHYRRKGFEVHGGLLLGVDLMLYRGDPDSCHAEFAVVLRSPAAYAETSEVGIAAAEGSFPEQTTTWRSVHLLYRLSQDVRKTLVIAHIRLGTTEREGSSGEVDRWYKGVTLFEVTLTPWKRGTPLAGMPRSRDAGKANAKRGRGTSRETSTRGRAKR